MTAPAAPGREPSRRSKSSPKEERKDRKDRKERKEREKDRDREREREKTKKIDVVEVKTELATSKPTQDESRSNTMDPVHRSTSRLSQTTKTIEKEETEEEKRAAEALRLENIALKLRLERAEKDMTSYRKNAKHYRERREEIERERIAAEERCKELETVVHNMKDSYEHEIEDLINFTQTAAAALRPSRSEPSVKGPAVRDASVRAPTVRNPTVRDPSVRAPTVHEPSIKAPTIRDPSIRAHIIRDPSVRAPTIRDPSVRAPTARDPSVRAPTAYAPSVRASTVRDPSIKAPTIQEPSIRAPSIRDPSVRTTYSVREPSLINVYIHKTTVEDEVAETESAPRSVHTEHITARLPPPRPLERSPAPRPASINVATAILAQVQKQELEAEMRALRYFHEEETQLTVIEVATMVRALNAELADIAMQITESQPFGQTWKSTQAWALDVADPALEQSMRMLAGPTSTSSRKGHNYANDTTVVRLALQSWIVRKIEAVFSCFLFGLDDKEDEQLRKLHERIRSRGKFFSLYTWL